MGAAHGLEIDRVGAGWHVVLEQGGVRCFKGTRLVGTYIESMA